MSNTSDIMYWPSADILCGRPSPDPWPL